MTGEPIQPPSTFPDDEPLVSVCINRDWIPYLIGMVYPSRYPEYWGGTLEENRNARKGALTLMAMLTAATEDCNMKDCCVEPVIITRVDPETGQIQQSSDGGTTWSPAANTLNTVITTPIPPVTSGVAGAKCDAAANVEHQIENWITQVTDDFDSATSLTEFATAVFVAILSAVLVILSAGALTPLEALIIPTLGAALAAAWGAGKVVFETYWTDAIKKEIRCAAFDCMADDGSFTDAQFSCFWTRLNTGGKLPPSPAKMLLMGFLSSSGTAGINAMAASGYSSDANCDDCSTLCPVDWTWYGVHDVVRDGNDWTMKADGGGVHVAFSSGNAAIGCYCTPNQLDTWNWWPIGSGSPVGGTNPRLTAVWNMDAGDPPAETEFHFTFSLDPIT